MNADECIIRDCSAMYRFQFASIAFLCILYLPYTFHANIWSLYTQSWTSVNCSDVATLIHAGFPLNATNKFFSSNSNRSDCCPCYDFLHGKRKDHQLFTSCQTWFEKIYGLETRKGNIIDEWYLSCGENSQENLLLGSLSFLVAEIIGVIIVGILADRYGRKLMLLMCLYVPVLFGSLAAFTTTYSLFLILRWPVGFLNRGLLVLVYLMVIESCEYKSRSQIACLLLASIPIFGILIGITYFFLVDWRHMQLLGSLITTLTLCYPWLIPESRRWYVNSHRVARVNKLLQVTSVAAISSLNLTQMAPPSASSTIYDKPILSTDSARIQTGSLSSFLLDGQLRTITSCLVILWFLLSFCYQCTTFPIIVTHPIMNYVLMNAMEFLSFIAAVLIASKIGRRVPLAVLILISGLSSVSLAITFLGTGHTWLEVTLSLTARACLRICYCLLFLFTSELYPTSIRATGLGIGLASDLGSRLVVEILLYLLINRTLLLFVSGGVLCLTCCLLLPLPETLLYDLPDSLTDLHSMRHAINNEHTNDPSHIPSHYHMIDANTVACPRPSQSNNTATSSDLHDLLALSPKTMFKSSAQDEDEQTLRFHADPGPANGLTNLCYFASVNDTLDQYPVEQAIDNRVMISRRGAQHTGNHNNNNNNNPQDSEMENTKL